MIDECIERDREGERERVNCDTSGGDFDKKRDVFWKSGIEGRLGVQELRRAKIQRGRGGSTRRDEKGRHRRREGCRRAGAAAGVQRAMH